MSDQDATETDQTDEVTTDDASTDTGADAAADDTEGEEALGDAGKQALDRMKVRHKTERDARKAAEAELATLKAAKPKDGDDKAPDVEQIREQARAEARAEVLKDRVADKIVALAAKDFADADDAAIFLRDQTEDFIDGDKVDVDAIREALADLLEKKPRLAAVQDGKRFQGGADGGARKESRPAQLTRSDLDNMTPEQINVARREGRLANVL